MAAREDRDAPPREDDEPGDGGPAEAARFVSARAVELAQLSRRHGHEMLGYLLDMAQLEADEIVRRNALNGL